jgi:hypothetical protein
MTKCQAKDCKKNNNGLCRAKPNIVNDKAQCVSFEHIPGFERRK